MIHFPNKTLERYTLATGNDTGIYGETLETYVYAGNIRGDFQNENNEETRRKYGVDKHNLYKFYIDENIELLDTDVYRDNDTGDVYEVIGEIQAYNHFHHYQRLHLIHSTVKITPPLIDDNDEGG